MSKFLVKVLRHSAEKMGLSIRSDGYIPVSEILSLPTFRTYSAHDIQQMVEHDAKNRFECSTCPETGVQLIRASQGHSIPSVVSDHLLTEIEDPSFFPVVLHGTYYPTWEQHIQKKGLSRMKRNHIHFTTSLPTEEGIVSGMRNNCDVAIYIDMERAMRDQFRFYISSNHVILCEGNEEGFLPRSYFKQVMNVKTGEILSFHHKLKDEDNDNNHEEKKNDEEK